MRGACVAQVALSCLLLIIAFADQSLTNCLMLMLGFQPGDF